MGQDNPFNEAPLTSSYPLQEAIEDGTLAPLFQNRWPELSGGKPIIVTGNLLEDVSQAALREVWNAFVVWKQDIEPSLPSEERLFTAKINNNTVWVIEDASAFTIMYPEDY